MLTASILDMVGLVGSCKIMMRRSSSRRNQYDLSLSPPAKKARPTILPMTASLRPPVWLLEKGLILDIWPGTLAFVLMTCDVDYLLLGDTPWYGSKDESGDLFRKMPWHDTTMTLKERRFCQVRREREALFSWIKCSTSSALHCRPLYTSLMVSKAMIQYDAIE